MHLLLCCLDAEALPRLASFGYYTYKAGCAMGTLRIIVNMVANSGTCVDSRFHLCVCSPCDSKPVNPCCQLNVRISRNSCRTPLREEPVHGTTPIGRRQNYADNTTTPSTATESAPNSNTPRVIQPRTFRTTWRSR